MGGKSGKMGGIRMGVYTGMGRRQNRWIPIQAYTYLFSVRARQGHIRPRQSFFAYSELNINFKGVHMKLKIVGLEIFRGIVYFTNFYDVSRLRYRPSNFAGANKPYAAG